MTRFALFAVIYCLATSAVLAGVIDGQPDPAPEGYYTSPVVLPIKSIAGDGGLATPLAKARAFVAELSLAELLRLTVGTVPTNGCGGFIAPIPRLGFPGICLNDGPIGVRASAPTNTSAFPAGKLPSPSFAQVLARSTAYLSTSGIAVAATFDRSLMYARGLAIGEEFRGKGVHVALGPGMNMMRAPAAGRNWEMAGGDPFLAGAVAYETVQSIQSSGVIACAKHLVGNEQEHFRGVAHQQASSSNIDDRTMHEIYTWPFAESVRAGVGSIMCSYNQVNSTYACENSKLLNGILKEELDYQGFVVSDWFADNNYVSGVLAGMDLSMPGLVPDAALPLPSTTEVNPALQAAYDTGVVSKGRLEDMVVRVMTQYFRFGQDAGFPAISLNDPSVSAQGDHAKIIREVGAASMVLLKNLNTTLPLTAAPVSYGIFGGDARANPNGINSCMYQACAEGHIAQGWGSGSANYPYLIDPVSAITDFVKAADSSAVVGSAFDDFDLAAATTLAQASDVCLVFVSANAGENVANVDNNFGDRNNLTLWHEGETLIKTVASSCSNTVVVMNIVGPVILETFIHNPNVTAVIMAGLPGQESGNALVDVIFGAVAPSGRLPYTMGKTRGDYAADVVYTAPFPSVDTQQVPGVSGSPVPGVPVQINYDEALLLDYRWFDQNNIEPTFPFGFGLSYTTFDYSNLKVASALATRHRKRAVSNVPGGPSALYQTTYTATFTIANSGDVDSHEILRGFERTFVASGSNSTVSIELNRKAVSIWDVISQSWIIPTGEFTILVGRSSRDLPISAKFTI